MATFKVKYCHKVFGIVAVRQLADALLHEAFGLYEIHCKKLAFASDHVHIILDMGLYSKPEIAKKTERLSWKTLAKPASLAEKIRILGEVACGIPRTTYAALMTWISTVAILIGRSILQHIRKC